MAKYCSECGKQIGLLSKKYTHEGKLLCDTCHYIKYRRYSYEPLPDKLIGKAISLSCAADTVYEINDRILTKSFTKNKYAFHILLHAEPVTNCHRKYIGIEIASGRVFEIEEHEDLGGADSPASYTAVISPISQPYWEAVLMPFPDIIREKLRSFSVMNAGGFLNSVPVNTEKYESQIFLYPNANGMMIFYSDSFISFRTLHIYNLSYEQYECFKAKHPSLYDMLLSVKELVPFLQNRYSWRKKEYPIYTNMFEQLCNSADGSGEPNCLYLKNCGRVLHQSCVSKENIDRLAEYISGCDFNTRTILDKVIK